jgi:hypothetical protein
MDANVSPEDKLLRLIKGGKPSGPGAGSPRLSLPFAGIFSKFLRIKGSRFNLFKIEYLTGLAWVVFIAALSFMGISAGRAFFSSKNIGAGGVSNNSHNYFNNESAGIKPFSFYQAVLDKRQIFNQPVSGGVKEEKTPGINMAEIISQYNLSGIVSGDNPKAIIEDKKSQKSYFLREGESAGDLTVEKIGAGKVSLDYKGEKFELVL